ncbi:hypothetical protein F8388_006056 [Cannabis sativa]|uniref:Uncharacterized protein n=1 Tax=Cannabis sativa TaxID=3483 RepID=A0A7J6IAS3_CANSA|nr:hypothetical protein F8388_006056 [Cannabis sativa]KAF4404693.1 hypothetical protein G4B88_006079 [Cannabis sativa]
MPCLSIYDSSDPKNFSGDRQLKPDMECCRSSSLGRNSDVSDESSNGEDSTNDEAQNSFKGPLDTMDGLEEVLPIKYVSF